MNKPYLIMVNNTLWAKKLTKHGALQVIASLNAKWEAMGSKTRAVLAYDITGGV